jgi:Tfp pilus assembly protein PilO
MNILLDYLRRSKITEVDALKQENAELKAKLEQKQQQINQVNKYWKGKLHSLTSGKKTK